MSIPENVNNPDLYIKAKAEANKKFDEPSSAYRSMYIVKRYKELGGTYKNRKIRDDEGTTQWLREKWIQVIPFITKNEEIECGSDERNKKACRPLKRVEKDTPITIKEVIDKHGKEKVLELATKKNKDMSGRLDWRKGIFKPKK